jgi:hypothetical protein
VQDEGDHWDDETMGAEVRVGEIPADMLDEAKQYARSWSRRSAEPTTS